MIAKLTDAEFGTFLLHYQKLRLGNLDCAFAILWRSKLDGFQLVDLTAAVIDLAADPRAGFPLNDLPILIEHATARADARRPGWTDPLKGQPVPERTTLWNRKMLEFGVIDKKEFAKREWVRA